MNKSTFAKLATVAISLLFSLSASAGESLETILEAQDDSVKARYEYRNPQATLEFFGIKPGMAVGEILPGGGWYTKILLPYLGKEGSLVGVDYDAKMWPHFGGFATEEFIEKRKSWSSDWSEKARGWSGETGPSVSGTTLATFGDDAEGSLDAVLFIRALHNLARFSSEGPYLSDAIAATFKALKPGGIVGIVQHQAREDRPDEWANGSNGYVKKSMIVNAMASAGFLIVDDSSVNENPKDQASTGDQVWRLPPSLAGTKDNEELKAEMKAIGESNRMTLKFIKPANNY